MFLWVRFGLLLTFISYFCHNRDFIYEPRGFSNVWEMNQTIVERYNRIVEPEDDVYVLGDLMLNDDMEGLRLIKQLKGYLHIVRGNHDTERRLELYQNCWNVDEIVDATYLNYGGYHFYLSHFPTLTSNFDNDKPLKQRTINLCGHTHTDDMFLDWDRYKAPIVHCEVDVSAGYPWRLETIIDKMEMKRAEG